MKSKNDNLGFGAKFASAGFMTLIFCVGTFAYGIKPVFGALALQDGKTYSFSTYSVILLSEVGKFAISWFFLIHDRGVSASVAKIRSLSWKQSFVFAIPGLVYMGGNNLTFFALEQMDSATFQVLSNIKILTTALLFRLVMGKELTIQKWLALGFLFIGSSIVTAGGLLREQTLKGQLTGESLEKDENELYVSVWGLVYVVSFCTCSALAGVYSEYVVKKGEAMEESIHVQNIQMYFWGMVFNYQLYVYQTGGFGNLLEGYHHWAWIICLNQMLMGLVVSAVMKFANNIMKLFMNATAMFFTTFMTWIIWKVPINGLFVLALLIVSVALALYNLPTFGGEKKPVVVGKTLEEIKLVGEEKSRQ